MKALIKLNTSNPKNCDGYELHIIQDDGTLEVYPILRKDKQKAGNYCYHLPTNPTNVKWISDKRICDGLEIGFKEESSQSPILKQPLENFLDASEKETYLRLVKIATERRQIAASTPISKEEKLRREIEKLQKQLAQLENK